MSKFARAAAILNAGLARHPSHVFLMLSGGNDSLSSTHFAASWLRQMGKPFKILHINTGIGIPDTREHVYYVCMHYGWDLLEVRAKEDCGQDYEALVIEQGFPGPAMHGKMFNRLKGRCLEKVLRDHKNGNRRAPIMFVSGMRKQESARRMRLKPEPIQKIGRQLFVAPFFELDTDEMLAYRSEAAIPESPVRKYLCMSGECLCGAFAAPGELKEIELWFPETGKRIREIAAKVTAAGFPWGWGEKPPKGWIAKRQAEKAGQTDAFPMLCTTCEFKQEQRSASAKTCVNSTKGDEYGS